MLTTIGSKHTIEGNKSEHHQVFGLSSAPDYVYDRKIMTMIMLENRRVGTPVASCLLPYTPIS